MIYRGLQEEGIWDAVHAAEPPYVAEPNVPFQIPPKPTVKNVRATMNPISSWSARMQTAYQFGGVSQVTGVLLAARVPAARIWSTAVSGPGALNEYEYIVLGGDVATVTAAKAEPKFVNSFLSEAMLEEHLKTGKGKGAHDEKTHGNRAGKGGLPPTRPLPKGPLEGSGPEGPRLSDQEKRTVIQWAMSGDADPQVKALLSGRVPPDLLAKVREFYAGEQAGFDFIRLGNSRGNEIVLGDPEVKQRNVAETAERTLLNLRAAGNTTLGTANVYDFADEIQREWASSSSNGNERSLAVQMAVAQKFGLTAASDQLRDGTMASRIWPSEQWWNEKVQAVSRDPLQAAYVKAVYDNTQAKLAKAGITELPLYRGMVMDPNSPVSFHDDIKQLVKKGTDTVMSNPLTSWSASRVVALDFTHRGDRDMSVLMKAMVPASRIWSTAQSGPGCRSEYEYIVLGGEMEVAGEYVGGGWRPSELPKDAAEYDGG